MLSDLEHAGHELSCDIRDLGRRCRWQPLGPTCVIVVGQVGRDDYFTPLEVHGRITFTEERPVFSGDIPDDITRLAWKRWRERSAARSETA